MLGIRLPWLTMITTTNLPLLVLLELPGLTPTVWGEPCEAGSEEGGAGGMVGDWREERMGPGSMGGVWGG